MDDNLSFNSCSTSDHFTQPTPVWTPKPTFFDGTTDVEDWLYTFEELGVLNNWTETYKANLIPTLLTAEARTWWRSNASEGRTEALVWKTVKSDLIKRFKPTPNAGMAWSKLLSLKQTASTQSYIDKFNLLAKDCTGITETAKKNIFIYGLKPWLRDRVFNNEPEDFKEAKESAIKCETFNTLSYEKPVANEKNIDDEISTLESKLSQLKILRQEHPSVETGNTMRPPDIQGS